MQLSCNSTRLAGPRRATSATSSRGATAPVRRCARPRHVSVCTAAAPASVTSAGVAGSSPAPAVYTPPSARIAANELQALSRLSKVVPDTLLLGAPVKLQAGTVSAQVLKGILAGGQLGLKPYLTAVENSLSYDRCRALAGAARADCQLEKALANVGAMLAPQVEGRVATELDARLAGDSAALVKAAKSMLARYEENGVPASKLIFRVPGTWAAIRAAAELEADGIATQVFHVYSMAQGVAAAQAGVSVVQPNVGRTRDWYAKHPGVIRDPHGPREDSGFASRVDPGVQLASSLYSYIKAFHPKTAVMASGLRSKDDALALAGCDYLVLPARVMADLEAAPTLQGYNSGLTAAASADDDGGVARALAPGAPADVPELPKLDEAAFNEGLGLAGKELLAAGVAGLVADVQAVLPYFSALAKSAE